MQGVAFGQDEQPTSPVTVESDGVLFVVTFGGGGTRAAAFSFGVATALQATVAGQTSLLERIDRVALGDPTGRGAVFPRSISFGVLRQSTVAFR